MKDLPYREGGAQPLRLSGNLKPESRLDITGTALSDRRLFKLTLPSLKTGKSPHPAPTSFKALPGALQVAATADLALGPLSNVIALALTVYAALLGDLQLAIQDLRIHPLAPNSVTFRTNLGDSFVANPYNVHRLA